MMAARVQSFCVHSQLFGCYFVFELKKRNASVTTSRRSLPSSTTAPVVSPSIERPTIILPASAGGALVDLRCFKTSLADGLHVFKRIGCLARQTEVLVLLAELPPEFSPSASVLFSFPFARSAGNAR
jgi:hypothetical protein